MEKQNFTNKLEVNTENKNSLIEKNLESKKQIEVLIDELGGIDEILTTVTPEIQESFGNINLVDFMGRITRAESALSK